MSGLRLATLGPWRLVIRDAYGHSPSMVTVHPPEHRILMAADMLSDIEIRMLHQPCAVYRHTLLELLPRAAHGAIETSVPGHGSIARTRDEVLKRLQRDLFYWDHLERGVDEANAAELSLEQTQSRLEGMEYLGKRAEYSMVDAHRANVRPVYRDLHAAPGGPRGRRGRVR